MPPRRHRRTRSAHSSPGSRRAGRRAQTWRHRSNDRQHRGPPPAPSAGRTSTAPACCAHRRWSSTDPAAAHWAGNADKRPQRPARAGAPVPLHRAPSRTSPRCAEVMLPSPAKTPAKPPEILPPQHNPRRNMFGELTSRARPRRRPRQPHEERPTGVVLQVAYDPVGPLPPSGGKVMATNAFGILRESADHIFCFQ